MRELGKADMGDVWTSPWARATLVSNFYSLVLDNLTDARLSVSESEHFFASQPGAKAGPDLGVLRIRRNALEPPDPDSLRRIPP